MPKTVALGLLLRPEIPADVHLTWLNLLRTEFWPGPVYTAKLMYPVAARNAIIQQALADPDAQDFVQFWDDDMIPSLNLPRYASDHAEVGIKAGLYFSERAAHPLHRGKPQPLAYHWNPQGWGFDPLEPRTMLEIFGTRPNDRGLMEIDGAGTGALRLRMDVIRAFAAHKRGLRWRDLQGQERVGRPFFETPLAIDVACAFGTPSDELEWEELLAGGEWHEDLYFCHEARQMGYKVWLDPRFESGHVHQKLIGGREYYEAWFQPGPALPPKPKGVILLPRK